MKSLKLILVLLSIFLFTGCVVPKSNLEVSEKIHDNVKIIDNRTEDKKERFRDGLFSPTVKLSDDTLSPTLINYFKYKLELKTKELINKKLLVEIDELSVFDNFPERLNLLYISKGISYIHYENFEKFKDRDHILIHFKGKVNNENIDTSHAEIYRASIFSLSVYNDKEFKKALDKSFNIIINKVISNLQPGG